MSDFSAKRSLSMFTVGLAAVGLIGCAANETDQATPTPQRTGMNEKPIESLTSGGGYKQDADGNWVANSNKRSSFDNQRESSFKGELNKETYKTGEYARKSWWGSKEYGSKEYAGSTDGSRFQKEARQNGQEARGSGEGAREGGTFETNTLTNRSARESNAGSVDRGSSEYVESARDSYQAPSIIDWKAQRSMSRDQSRSILGR